MTNGTTKHSRHALQPSRRPQAGAVLDRRRARRPYLRAGRDERKNGSALFRSGNRADGSTVRHAEPNDHQVRDEPILH